jgi:sialic acid synthase SpsE
MTTTALVIAVIAVGALAIEAHWLLYRAWKRESDYCEMIDELVQMLDKEP